VLKITGADGSSFQPSSFIASGSGGLDTPAGVLFGPNGEFFVVDNGTTTTVGQVLEYKANGTFDKVFTQAGSLSNLFPSDAVFTSDGSLLTANLGGPNPPAQNAAIFQFSPTGASHVTLVDSTKLPTAGKAGFSPTNLVLLDL
jgi:hypothetical protein